MAPQAHLWALKVLDSEGSGDLSYSVEALNDVYDFRNNFGPPVRVVNMSLEAGAPYDSNCDSIYPAMTTAMQKLIGVNIPVVVAAGNQGCSNGVRLP